MSIIKQKQLIQKIAGNNGKPASQQQSLRQLLLEAGYSESAADNPERVINSKSMKELTDIAFPDWEILGKLRKNALQDRSLYVSNTAIDMILKIKGKYAPTKVSFTDPTENMTDAELDAEIARLEKLVKRTNQPQNPLH